MRGDVLVIDDERGMCEVLAEGLTKRGFTVAWETSGEAALERLRGGTFEVVVTDMNMRGLTGFDVCERIVANHRDLPVVIITAFASLENAITAIRTGAYDFLTKPVRLDALALALDRAVAHRRLKSEVERLRSVVAATRSFEALLGQSAPMRALYDLIERVATTDATVLVTGETGSGKELVARAVHARSRRSAAPFVALNCAAMPEALLESELFGHVRGAFTDARATRPGLFARAAGGTLFLDEIGDMPLNLQAKLLRAVQERTIRPVGADVDVPFDARLVAATHRDLEEQVERGAFRQDLYFRLNVIELAVPPLRARGADVLLLAQAFLDQATTRSGLTARTLSSPAAARLLNYPWPGNVRELANCIERAVALAAGAEILVDDLPERIRGYRPTELVLPTQDPEEILPLDEVERRYILKSLESLRGNKRLTARVLGLDRRTLYRKLERYGYGGGEDPDAAGD
jgi:two-component system response regulator HydG